MPTTYAIPDGRTVMAATTYTGTGATASISNSNNGVSFQPDLVWIKERSNNGFGNALFDSVRGAPRRLGSNLTEAENTTGSFGQVSAFNSNGFTVATGSTSFGETGGNGYTYVGWQWKAGGTAVTNTSGTITSSVSANPTAGFSVVTYTGTGVAATVGHGLGVAPSFILAKGRTNVDNWRAYHSSLGNTGALIPNATNTFVTNSTFWNNTSPTSSVVSIGTDTSVNQSTITYVMFCWAPVAGYSAFGSYTGNGSADGPFIYTGFRPRWIMQKISSGTANWWAILDTSRDTYNVLGEVLQANAANAGANYTQLDVLSNGFKIRTTGISINESGSTFVYAAFAETPFKYANAR